MFVEFSADNEIVGVEILNASETVSDLTGKKFTSVELGNIKDAELKMFTREDFVFVNLFFNMVTEGETVEERIGVNIPTKAVTA